MFLHLLALGDGSSESFDAVHVSYPLAFAAVPTPPQVVAVDVQRRQRPDVSSKIGKVRHSIIIHAHILALGNGSSDVFCTARANFAATDIQQAHPPSMKLKHTC